MASYVETVITPGEQVLHDGRLSAWSQFWFWFFGLIGAQEAAAPARPAA